MRAWTHLKQEISLNKLADESMDSAATGNASRLAYENMDLAEVENASH
jgi:hypothetical protein